MVKKIAVLGGGVSGLTAAWNLARKGVANVGSQPQLEIALYEASNRVGGWIKSERSQEGAVFELGPRSLRTAGVAGKTSLELITSLGLEKELLHVTAGHVSAQKRFIYTEKDGLVEAPAGFSWLFQTKRPFTKPLIGAIMKDIFTKKGTGDESIYDFFTRRMSSEVADYLVDPLCRGVFASSPRHLSLRSCFPQFHKYEAQFGSVTWGLLSEKEAPLDSSVSPVVKQSVSERWTTLNMKNGLQTLTDTLLKQITEKGVKVSLEQPCTSLTFEDGKFKVEAGGKSEEFDHVVSSIPASVLSKIMAADSPSVSAALGEIKNVSVGVACLEFKGKHVLPESKQDAFGYLVPSSQKSDILGVVFDSASFPQHDRKDEPSVRLTVMLGGEWFEELFGSPSTAKEDTIKEAALKTLHEHLGISQEPTHAIVNIHKECIPQYSVGHSDRLDTIFGYITEKQLPLTLVGSSYRGVSVNDCIYHALQSTNKLI